MTSADDKENTSPNVNAVKRKAALLAKMDGAFPRAYTPNDALKKKSKASTTPAQQLSPIPPNKRPYESAASGGKEGVLAYFKETTFTPLHKKIMHRVGSYECEVNERFVEKARTPMRGSAFKAAATALVDTSLSFSLDRSQPLDIDLSLSILREETRSAPHVTTNAVEEAPPCTSAPRPIDQQQQQIFYDIEMYDPSSIVIDECTGVHAEANRTCASLERFSMWASAYAAFTLTVATVLIIAALAGTAALRGQVAAPAAAPLKTHMKTVVHTRVAINSTLFTSPFIPCAVSRVKQPKCNISDAHFVDLYTPSGNAEFRLPISLHTLPVCALAAYTLPSPRRLALIPAPTEDISTMPLWWEVWYIQTLAKYDLFAQMFAKNEWVAEAEALAEAAASAPPTDLLRSIVAGAAACMVARRVATMIF